jgi:hypothetical protein
MTNYFNLFKNLAIVILCVAVLKLWNVNRQLSITHVKDLQKQRKQSERVVAMKENEVESLRVKLNDEEFILDEAVTILNDLRGQRVEVETLYVERIQKVSTFDANELKAYFNDELN